LELSAGTSHTFLSEKAQNISQRFKAMTYEAELTTGMSQLCPIQECWMGP